MTPIRRKLFQFNDSGGRRGQVSIRCEGQWIVCSYDRTGSRTGLLIVSGGNEIAIGPQRSMARLAAMIADQGWSVVRFDRRGVGDSGGVNRGYASIGPDIVAARHWASHIGVTRLVAFGNCDGATALATLPINGGPSFHSRGAAPIVARLLGNPWLGDREDGLPPAAAIRDRYRRRLIDPDAWRALLSGRISLNGLRKGLGRLASAAEPNGIDLISRLLEQTPLHTEIVLSSADATGIGFADAWRRTAPTALRRNVAIHHIDTASHGFTRDADLRLLSMILTRMLRAVDDAT